MTHSISYKDAGVNIDAANDAVSRIKKLAKTTFNENVLSDIGSFGGMFSGMFPQMREPVLVASCDGVGTKLKIAFATGVHHTIGYDLVSACVGDILVQGARPLFFLDYIATGRLEPGVVESVIEGMTRGCRESGCALLGGEIAEMPGFYGDGEYDLAGFIVGVVDRARVIDGSRITAGDVVFGLPSLGLHTNGYSLARKLLLEIAGHQVDTYIDELGCTVGEELLKPHRSYMPALERLLEHEGLLRGLAHITGGGLVENIPRVLHAGVDVVIREDSWPVLPVFDLMRRIGQVSREEMLRTFNLGIGMALIVSPADADRVRAHFADRNEALYEIGQVVRGSGHVQFA
ncbi:MAG: phosphoribosylformylglycinamidine cyclo-ligase [Blastocatellia bacterium]